MELKDYVQGISEKDFDKLQESTEEKIEFHNGQILYSSTTSQRHNDIIANINAVLKHIVPNGCKVFSESIELRLEDKNKGELYKYKPDLFVVCGNYKSKGETVIEVPKIIFEVISPKYDTHDTITKRLIYEKFGVLEYNIIFQDGSVIQHFHNGEKYDLVINKKGDMFKSNIYKGLNIPVENLIEEGYSKKLVETEKLKAEKNEKINIAKNFLDILNDKEIAIRTGLSVEEVKELRK